MEDKMDKLAAIGADVPDNDEAEAAPGEEALRCKLCGGEMSRAYGYEYVCQSCGCKAWLPA